MLNWIDRFFSSIRTPSFLDAVTPQNLSGQVATSLAYWVLFGAVSYGGTRPCKRWFELRRGDFNDVQHRNSTQPLLSLELVHKPRRSHAQQEIEKRQRPVGQVLPPGKGSGISCSFSLQTHPVGEEEQLLVQIEGVALSLSVDTTAVVARQTY
eukprot:s1703_g7.t1